MTVFAVPANATPAHRFLVRQLSLGPALLRVFKGAAPIGVTDADLEEAASTAEIHRCNQGESDETWSLFPISSQSAAAAPPVGFVARHLATAPGPATVTTYNSSASAAPSAPPHSSTTRSNDMTNAEAGKRIDAILGSYLRHGRELLALDLVSRENVSIDAALGILKKSAAESRPRSGASASEIYAARNSTAQSR